MLDSSISGDIVILDKLDSDASFLIHHFIAEGLKTRQNLVVVVALSQIYSHFVAVGKKLGYDLLRSSKEGNLLFIDAISRVSLDKLDVPLPKTSAVPHYYFQLGHSTQYSNIMPQLGFLYELISNISKKAEADGRKITLIFDDLTLFSVLGIDSEEINRFLSHCHLLLEKEPKGHMVTLIKRDFTELTSLINTCIFRAQFVITTKGLSSGYSKEIDGTITLGRGPKLERLDFVSQELNFKVTENNLKLFGKGLNGSL